MYSMHVLYVHVDDYVVAPVKFSFIVQTVLAKQFYKL